MSWRHFENHAEETKAVKAALKAAGINAEVGHGKGTAWAWLEINVGKSPHKPHDPRNPSCGFCDRRNEIVSNVIRIAQEVTGRHGDYDGEIIVLTQDGWSKSQKKSYSIEQPMDIEERKAHPELCRDYDNDLKNDNSPKTGIDDSGHNRVTQSSVDEDDKKTAAANVLHPDTLIDNKESLDQNPAYKDNFAYRIESRRVKDTDFPYGGQSVHDSHSVASFVDHVLKDADAEKLIVLYLDSRNKILGVTYNQGTANACSVYPGQILKTALLTGATGVILVHNHPSGGLLPSLEDKKLTINTVVVLSHVGLQLHDHLIYTSSDKYYSFADDGKMIVYEKQVQESLKSLNNVNEPSLNNYSQTNVQETNQGRGRGR